MHKSVIYLLGLLVILMPIGTSMNVMGIAENEYYTDKYMGYANDMVNEYEDESSYANNDGYESDSSSYGNDNYDLEYPSYKHDYNSDYQSYGYDNKYKSKDKDRDSSVSTSKIKCENVNNNFNNNVIENLNIGNSGRGGDTSDDRTNGVLSANANGNNGERYNDGYQKAKGVSCIINNNNTIITAGNATDDNGNEILTCEECFNAFLTPEQIDAFLPTQGNFETLADYCADATAPNTTVSEAGVRQALTQIGVSQPDIDSLIECLENIGVIFT